MAHRLLRCNSVRKNTVKDFAQSFKYLLIIDIEATCQKDTKLKPQEIIELPCLALSTETWEVKDVFHEYIKPQINPILTSYCTDLTGIIQEMIDDRPFFPEVFLDFQEWLDQSGYLNEGDKSAFITCGDWDLRVMLPEQCATSKVTVPAYFNKWINLKKSFLDATGHYPRSLRDMLKYLNLPICGHLHSGIHDAHNMTRIIQLLGSQRKVNFDITSTLDIDKKQLFGETNKRVFQMRPL